VKYIMFETAEGAKLPVIFSDQFVHLYVGEVFKHLLKGMNQPGIVVSAGFVGLGTDVTVSGESESLGGVKSVESDAARIMVGDSVMFMPDAAAEMVMGKLREQGPISYPTEDAYMRACRALHWRTAQLRAHGIEPDPIADDAPHDPPEGHVFTTVSGSRSDRDVAVGEHAFRAGFEACAQNVVTHDRPLLMGHTLERAWSDYTPPEDLCGG